MIKIRKIFSFIVFILGLFLLSFSFLLTKTSMLLDRNIYNDFGTFTDWRRQRISLSSPENQMLSNLNGQDWKKNFWMIPILYGLKEIEVSKNGQKTTYKLDKIGFWLGELVRDKYTPQFPSDLYTYSSRRTTVISGLDCSNKEAFCFKWSDKISNPNWGKSLWESTVQFPYFNEGEGRNQLLKLFDSETKKFKAEVEQELLAQASLYLEQIFANIVKPLFLTLKERNISNDTDFFIGNTNPYSTRKNLYRFEQLLDSNTPLDLNFKFKSLSEDEQERLFKMLVEAAGNLDLVKWAFFQPIFGNSGNDAEKLLTDSFFKIILGLGIQEVTVEGKKYDWSFLFDENKKLIKLDDFFQNEAKINELKALGYFMGSGSTGSEVRKEMIKVVRKKINSYLLKSRGEREESIFYSLYDLTKKGTYQIVFGDKSYSVWHLFKQYFQNQRELKNPDGSTRMYKGEPAKWYFYWSQHLNNFAGDEFLALATEVKAIDFNLQVYKLSIQEELYAFSEKGIDQVRVEDAHGGTVYNIANLIANKNTLSKTTPEVSETIKEELLALYRGDVTEERFSTYLEKVKEEQVRKEEEEKNKLLLKQEEERKEFQKKQEEEKKEFQKKQEEEKKEFQKKQEEESENFLKKQKKRREREGKKANINNTNKGLSVGLSVGGAVLTIAGVGGFLYWFFKIRK